MILYLIYFVLGLVVLMWMFQESLIYLPTIPGRALEGNPQDHGMPYQDIRFKSKDGTSLHAWYITQPNPSDCPTILYFHANAGNISHRLVHLTHLFRRCKTNIFILSYRGYGESAGSPSEQGIRLDAQAAIDYCLKELDIDPRKLVVFGRSIGGAVAIALAYGNQDKVAGVIVENTFTSLKDMMGIQFPFLKPRIFHRMLRNPWDSLDVIHRISVPILFISGRNDEIVPAYMMDSLYERAGASIKKICRVPDGTHNDTWQRAGAKYYDEILAFFHQALTAA